MDALRRESWVLFGLAMATVLVLGSYAIGYVPDAEDFNSTALTSSIFMETLFRGENPFWSPALGLGMPQPFRISLIQHPLGFLFGLLPTLIAVKVLVVLQGILGTAIVYILGRQLRMPPMIAGACACSYILCTSSLEFLHVDDFFSAFLSFCFYPAIILLFVLLDNEQSRGRALLLGVSLGTASGLLIATGLVSHVFSYVLVLGAFALARPKLLLRHALPFSIAALVCALIASGVAVLLVSELHRASQEAVRTVHANPGLWQQLHGVFSLNILSLFGSLPIDALTQAVLADSHRSIGFGAVAALAAAAALPVSLGRPARPFKVAFCAALIFLVLPAELNGNLITATWVFRDGVNLFGIVLFGLLASRLYEAQDGRRMVVPAACVLQVLILTALALPLVIRTTSLGLQPDRVQGNTFMLQDGGPFLKQLSAIAPPGGGRLLMSPSLAEQVRQRRLFRDGIVGNSLSLFGYSLVTVWARGIATGALHPDLHLLEGIVGATDRNLVDKAFLDVLGIGTVLAWEGEAVASALERVGTIETAGGRPVAVWRNAGAWPAVVPLRTAALEPFAGPDPSCGHDRFMCADLSPLHAAIGEDPVGPIEVAGGTISFAVEPAGTQRLFLVNTWYRPEWSAVDAGPAVLPVGGQLIGVLVPAGATSVTLRYLPSILMACYLIGTLVIVAGCVLTLSLLPGKRTPTL